MVSERHYKTFRDTERLWYRLKNSDWHFGKRLCSYFTSWDVFVCLIFVLFFFAREIFQPVVVENSFVHILIKFSKLLRNKNERLKARQLAMVALMRYIDSDLIMHFKIIAYIRYLPKLTGVTKIRGNCILTGKGNPHIKLKSMVKLLSDDGLKHKT